MSAIVTLGKAQRPPHEYEVGRLSLQGPLGGSLALDTAMTKTTLEDSIDGAGALVIVVRDRAREILRSNPIKNMPSTLLFNSVEYTLVKVSYKRDELTLTLEETAVNVLRRYDAPRKANRDNVTRAQFVRTLVIEPKEYKVIFRCPELNVKQPVAAG